MMKTKKKKGKKATSEKMKKMAAKKIGKAKKR